MLSPGAIEEQLRWTSTKPQRMWINQPSTQQIDHKLHGTLVYAVMERGQCATVYFLRGPIISQRVFKNALSPGWPEHLQQKAGPHD